MELNLNILEEFQQRLIQREVILHDLNEFNHHLRRFNWEYILCVNIRSLQANHAKLQAYIAGLEVEPSVIICTETWVIEHFEYFKIPGYNIYYKYSKINQNDGCVFFF